MRTHFDSKKWERVVDGIIMAELKCGWFVFETKVNHLYEGKAYYGVESDSKYGFTFDEAKTDFLNYISQIKERRKWH